jgi:hypothetical protein
VFLPKLENYSEFTKQIVMEVEDCVVNLPNTEIKEASEVGIFGIITYKISSTLRKGIQCVTEMETSSKKR